MDANAPFTSELKPTTADEMRQILVEVFGAVPIDQVFTKPGLTVRVVEE